MCNAVAAEAATVPARATPARRSPRLLGASLIVAAPGWLTWELAGRHSVASPLATSVVLALNVAATMLLPGLKLRAVRRLQRYVVNPLIRALLTVRNDVVLVMRPVERSCHDGNVNWRHASS